MRVIDEEELAELLSDADESHFNKVDCMGMGFPERSSWADHPEWKRDDYRAAAKYILERARVALKPTEK